jgi:hypothetical protein
MKEQLKTKSLVNFNDFLSLEDELQLLLEKYPNIDKIDVVYKPNSLSQSNINHLELAFSNSQCKIVYDDANIEHGVYFRLQFNRLGICTWNEITPMSKEDKDEERGIDMLEDDRQSN